MDSFLVGIFRDGLALGYLGGYCGMDHRLDKRSSGVLV